MNIGFVSLGCSKNLVDSEMLIGLFKKNGYNIVNNPEKADIIIVNTCGFIESAKQEAINTLLEMAEYKEKRCKYLIAMGCLVQRYKDELEKEMPEVDLFIKYDSYETIWDQIVNKIKEIPNSEINKLDYNSRVITTGDNYAYLRIADGCNNKCTFCAIPKIRGEYTSRKIEDIVEEAKIIAKKDIKELIVVAQDTTKYGIDIYGKPMLTKLLQELCKIEAIKWIRFLYAYPESITDELIDVVKNNDKICNYFDIPIQHISNKVLKRMNRKSTSESIYELIEKLRNKIPDVIIRTTVMVGFPGETNEDFEQLYEFIKKAKLDKMGAFMFSKEEGTPAEKLKEQIHHMTKKSRYNKIMEVQNKISEQKLKEKIGNTYKVLIEGSSFDNKYYIGRTYMDVPEIDGIVYIRKTKQILEGSFIDCKITDVNEYDLIAEII